MPSLLSNIRRYLAFFSLTFAASCLSGLTNFDLSRTKELVEAGVPVAATQVQLSPLDRRAIKSGLVQYAQR